MLQANHPGFSAYDMGFIFGVVWTNDIVGKIIETYGGKMGIPDFQTLEVELQKDNSFFKDMECYLLPPSRLRKAGDRPYLTIVKADTVYNVRIRDGKDTLRQDIMKIIRDASRESTLFRSPTGLLVGPPAYWDEFNHNFKFWYIQLFTERLRLLLWPYIYISSFLGEHGVADVVITDTETGQTCTVEIASQFSKTWDDNGTYAQEERQFVMIIPWHREDQVILVPHTKFKDLVYPKYSNHGQQNRPLWVSAWMRVVGGRGVFTLVDECSQFAPYVIHLTSPDNGIGQIRKIMGGNGIVWMGRHRIYPGNYGDSATLHTEHYMVRRLNMDNSNRKLITLQGQQRWRRIWSTSVARCGQPTDPTLTVIHTQNHYQSTQGISNNHSSVTWEEEVKSIEE